MQFTAEALADAVGGPLSEATSIDLRDKALTHIDGLSACRSLRRLDLSNNKIGSTEGLGDLQNAKLLVHVNLANNEFKDMSVVEQLPQLNVLNMSGNKLKAISASVAACSKLKAIILGQNKITRIEHLDKLGDLNTLVVSHNEVTKLPDMPQLKELTKISAAHNKIATIPDLALYPKLKEIRLNDNVIRTVPEGIRSCTSLRVIDLGNNMIDDWTSIAPLVSIPYLHNLNLKGNPICKEDSYRERIVQMLPSLRVLDGERFDQWFLDRKEKRKNRAMASAAADTDDDSDSNGEHGGSDSDINERPKRPRTTTGGSNRFGDSARGDGYRGRGRGTGSGTGSRGGANGRGANSSSGRGRGGARGRGQLRSGRGQPRGGRGQANGAQRRAGRRNE